MSDCDCPTYCPSCGEVLKEVEPSPRPKDVIGKWVDIAPYVKIHRVKSARYVGTGTSIVTDCNLEYGLYSQKQVSDRPTGERTRDCQNCVRKWHPNRGVEMIEEITRAIGDRPVEGLTLRIKMVNYRDFYRVERLGFVDRIFDGVRFTWVSWPGLARSLYVVKDETLDSPWVIEEIAPAHTLGDPR